LMLHFVQDLQPLQHLVSQSAALIGALIHVGLSVASLSVAGGRLHVASNNGADLPAAQTPTGLARASGPTASGSRRSTLKPGTVTNKQTNEQASKQASNRSAAASRPFADESPPSSAPALNTTVLHGIPCRTGYHSRREPRDTVSCRGVKIC
jgi:hypothetical protein